MASPNDTPFTVMVKQRYWHIIKAIERIAAKAWKKSECQPGASHSHGIP